MAYIYKDASAQRTSPLDTAPLDRAADVLRLARMGNGESRRMWNSWVAENPSTAGLVVRWVDQEDAEKAKATRTVDAVLARAERATPSLVTKGKKHKHGRAIVCLKCGTGLDAGEKHCTCCGRKNPHYTPMADRKIPMNKGKKKARKAARQVVKAQTAMLTKRAARETAIDFPAPSVYDPDPKIREIAWRQRMARRG
jgi:hypothetical protein